jgi:hypothetical protein
VNTSRLAGSHRYCASKNAASASSSAMDGKPLSSSVSASLSASRIAWTNSAICCC